MSSAGLAERPELPVRLTYSRRPKEGKSVRAYQLPKGGAGIDALVKVERPDPKAGLSAGVGES